ncbi:MAG: shikimate dehydrogenase [Thiotrichaceae bacterium]
MTTQAQSDSYAVMGNPIAHSKSPLIHATFARQTAQDLIYRAMLVDTAPGEFTHAVKHFRDNGGRGLNVTVPFKQHAWQLADIRTPRAERAGAVNTLWFDTEGKIHGDTTDGIGLVRDILQNQGGKIHKQRVLILGAGGAVRGVLEPLLQQSPSCCVIANRTMTKAQELAALFANENSLNACAYAELEGQQFDLVINGTSASLQGEVPSLPDNLLATNAWCYDMMYAQQITPFVSWAWQHGAVQASDGLGMLVEQAAESFFIWRGIRPQTMSVIQLLREQL